MTPTQIIHELNQDNSTNYKLEILRKYSDDVLFTRILKMTYDKVAFTYGITLKNIIQPTVTTVTTSIDEALNVLEREFSTRSVTGNTAHHRIDMVLSSLSLDDALVIMKVIDRDLKIHVGRTQINKVHKGLIIKPVYMRCSILTNKNRQKVKFPAIINLKADGTYREITVDGDSVTYNSRSGEVYDYPILTKSFSGVPEGKYVGELTVRLDESLIKKLQPKLQKLDTKNGTTLALDIQKDFADGNLILPRALGNGLLKSDDVPHGNIVCELWDYITLDEYRNAALRIKNVTKYIDRWNTLKTIIGSGDDHVKLIEAYTVNDFSDAMSHTTDWMKQGLEGSILKNFDAVFRDGTSIDQWKLKLVIEVDVRITGFIEGKKGTKREQTFGSIAYITDDGLVKGSVSGFNDAELALFNSTRAEMIDRIMTVECNDITQGRANDHHALSHPRFIELRDKDSTDTLDRIFEMKELAMTMSELM